MTFRKAPLLAAAPILGVLIFDVPNPPQPAKLSAQFSAGTSSAIAQAMNLLEISCRATNTFPCINPDQYAVTLAVTVSKANGETEEQEIVIGSDSLRNKTNEQALLGLLETSGIQCNNPSKLQPGIDALETLRRKVVANFPYLAPNYETPDAVNTAAPHPQR